MAWYRLFYHCVWTTKQRLTLITAINQQPLHAAIRSKVEELNGIVHALNSMPDHVHLLVSVPPTISLSDFIGRVKGSSSHLMSRLNTDFEPFAWQSDYGVLSASETHLPTIMRYIEQQENHHRNQTLDLRLETTANGA